MKLQSIAAVAALGVAVSGCATIIKGTTQSVSVETTPESGAQCTLKNTEGTWFVTSPGSTTVHKTKNNLSVDCTKPGFADGHIVVAPNMSAATMGNVLAGGLIGVGVDAASGANYYYDSPITVTLGSSNSPSPAMTPPPPPPEPAPAPNKPGS